MEGMNSEGSEGGVGVSGVLFLLSFVPLHKYFLCLSFLPLFLVIPSSALKNWLV